MKKKILCGLLFLASVFGFGLFSSLPAVASSGTVPINVTENWNTYSDQTGLHDNIYDGAVNIPYNMLNVDPAWLKEIYYSRWRTGALSIGDSQNLYNTISVKVVITTGSNSVSQRVIDGGFMVWGNLTDSDNVSYSVNTEDSTCAYVANTSRIEITCSFTLDNYKTLKQFDIRFGVSPASTSTHLYAIARDTTVRLASITVDYTGSQDPNVALNEQRNAILGQINSSLANMDHYQDEIDRENAKEAQLNQQKNGLGVSAQNTGNPFDILFNATGCQSLSTVSSWFGRQDTIQICSPYPSGIGGVIKFVGSALVVALLIRLYYKRLKGGYNG